MEITINTADMLGDETTIRDDVVNQIAIALIQDMRKQAKEKLAKMLDENLKKVVAEVVEEAVNIVTDTVYTDTDQYGRNGKTASLRNRITDLVQAQCTFAPKGYSSDENIFTRTVKKVTEDEVAKFEKEFNTFVNQQFVKETLDFAVTTLKNKFGF